MEKSIMMTPEGFDRLQEVREQLKTAQARIKELEEALEIIKEYSRRLFPNVYIIADKALTTKTQAKLEGGTP